MFLSEKNTILISRFDLIHGGEEIVHFVNSALKGDLYKPPPQRNTFDQFYTNTIEEALGYFGSKILAPERNFISLSEIKNAEGKILHPIMNKFNYNENELVEAVNFVNEHHRFEKAVEKYEIIPDIIKKYVSTESKLTPLLFHDLGYSLGEKLYQDYKNNKITKKQLKNLFGEEFTAVGSSFKTYIELISFPL